jgi:serine-type D-Ala-D-Ala endopeptidase (penicillin-binding protein 7)
MARFAVWLSLSGWFGNGSNAVAWRTFATLLLLAFNGAGIAAEPTAVKVSSQPILDRLALKSGAVLVVDQDTGETLAMKNADKVLPIASLTKVMTAFVVLDSAQPLDEILEITTDDIDREKRTPSRLKVGTRLSRDDLLILALMASENRAASALSRHYPGGRASFIDEMNAKARELGMRHTHFADPAGLSSRSVSTARDLHILLTAADAQPVIRDYSTRQRHTVRVARNRPLTFVSSNRLVRYAGNWDIELQKTGFTNEAGRCLVMQAKVADRRLAMIFLNSVGKLTRYGDASRVRTRLELEDRKRALSGGMTTAAP